MLTLWAINEQFQGCLITNKTRRTNYGRKQFLSYLRYTRLADKLGLYFGFDQKQTSCLQSNKIGKNTFAPQSPFE